MTDADFVDAFLDYMTANGDDAAYNLLQRLENVYDNKYDAGVCPRCGDTSSGYQCICYAR